MDSRLAAVCREALAGLIPPPKLRLSDWIEANVRLPARTSALPGAIKLYPFMRGIVDAIGDDAIERVTICKCVRVGYTTALVGTIAAYAINDPCPVLCILPTESDARGFTIDELEPIFRASPALRGVLSADADEEAERSTLLHRIFGGGSIQIVPARAPRQLRRRTARILLIDEADACETTAEGNPLLLAERRTLSFSNRKIVIGSTPLASDTSHVMRSYAASDCSIYECPCPACGSFREIMWSAIEWQDGKPETTQYRCEDCKALIPETEKQGMVAKGRWRATNPLVTSHRGFRLNALISPLSNAAWPRLAEEFLRAKSDVSELRVFINTVLGQPFAESADEVDESALQARAEAFTLSAIPAEVLTITVGCDVQVDRIEATVCGWTRSGECLVLSHQQIWGDPAADDTVWMELDQLLLTKWQHPNGGRLRVDAAAIDEGFATQHVRAFCFARSNRKVLSVKGIQGARPFITASQSRFKVGSGTGRIWLVGTDTIKSVIYAKLARGAQIRFGAGLDDEYYAQLASERRILKYTRGRPVRLWQRRPGMRAEALDCLTYSLAAHAMVQINLDAREIELRSPTPPKPQPAVIRSKWLDGGL